MRASARALWRERAFGDGVAGADRLFGHARDALARVPMSEWLMLLMNALIVEYNVAVLGLHEFRPAWGLRDCMLAIKTLDFYPPPIENERFHECFYVATHVAYALTAYNTTRGDERDAPALFR